MQSTQKDSKQPETIMRSLLLLYYCASSTTIFLVLLSGGLLEPVSAADDKPSCVDYSKGDFGPTTITSEQICQEACQTAEGLPVGDFNDNKKEGEPSDLGHQKCTCKKIDNNGNSVETRGLCEDGVPDTSGGPGGTMDGVVAGMTVAVTAAILAASL